MKQMSVRSETRTLTLNRRFSQPGRMVITEPQVLPPER